LYLKEKVNRKNDVADINRVPICKRSGAKTFLYPRTYHNTTPYCIASASRETIKIKLMALNASASWEALDVSKVGPTMANPVKMPKETNLHAR
jgi:hypothetical protein